MGQAVTGARAQDAVNSFVKQYSLLPCPAMLYQHLQDASNV